MFHILKLIGEALEMYAVRIDFEGVVQATLIASRNQGPLENPGWDYARNKQVIINSNSKAANLESVID
jgi:hypothetical protein